MSPSQNIFTRNAGSYYLQKSVVYGPLLDNEEMVETVLIFDTSVQLYTNEAIVL